MNGSVVFKNAKWASKQNDKCRPPGKCPNCRMTHLSPILVRSMNFLSSHFFFFLSLLGFFIWLLLLFYPRLFLFSFCRGGEGDGRGGGRGGGRRGEEGGFGVVLYFPLVIFRDHFDVS